MIGLNPNPENPEESEQLSLTEITGIVRRGETSNVLAGRRNWNELGIYNWVDLDYMGKIMRLFNLDSINTAYIERIVPAPEEGEEEGEPELYPIPANKNTFEKPLATPCGHKLAAAVLSASSILSIIAATLLWASKRDITVSLLPCLSFDATLGCNIKQDTYLQYNTTQKSTTLFHLIYHFH